MTRERKALGAILAIGLLGLGIDQLLLGSEATGPSEADAAPLPVQPENPVAVEAGRLDASRDAGPRPAEVLAIRLERLTLSEEFDGDDVPDMFKPAETWFPEPAQVVTAAAEPDQGMTWEQFLSRHRLVAVIVTGATPGAIIDGTFHRIGETIDGFTLVAVKDRTAVFASDSGRFEVALE